MSAVTDAGRASESFVPTGNSSRFNPPRAWIDRDQSKSWLRRALPIVLARRSTLFSALGLSFLSLMLQVQIPNLLNSAVANSLQHHHTPLGHYVRIVFVLAVAAGVSSYLARLFLMRTAYGIESDLRNMIYTHLTRMSFDFYDRVQSGQLISRANSDIRSVQMYLTFGPNIIVQCSIAVVAFIYMLTINVPLAFVAMCTLPVVFFMGLRMRRSLFPVSWLIQARLAEVATIVDENINGVRVVKSFVAEPRELHSLQRAADKLQWSYIQDADVRARFTPVVQNLPQVGMAFVLLVGGYLAIHGKLGVGAILAFSVYIVMLQAPFQMLGMLVMLGQRAAASAGRIYEVLDEQPSVVDGPLAVDLVNSSGDVAFEHVDFAYSPDGPLILDDLELRLQPGETVAMVGRTASGKSTVARLLSRFYDVTGGALKIDGHDVRELTVESLRHNVGVVLDEPFLFSVSIRDNIAYGRPDAPIEEIQAAARAAGAERFIEALPHGYDTVVGERGYTLSGGQRQRVAIARTLLVNPPILVLDDATSAVDVQVEQEIHEALKALMHGRTTLIVAHRLSTIGLADRVVLLDGGRIVADGTHTELIESSPLYVEVLAQAEADEREQQQLERERQLGLAARSEDFR
ncbi:MAG TPA: ABC transporter ATP-binding protein [Solirubrobacteraceae bacterium]|nr:ABC transporter ATP-binding protein [Solirubrobacteraceae bacterium]